MPVASAEEMSVYVFVCSRSLAANGRRTRLLFPESPRRYVRVADNDSLHIIALPTESITAGKASYNAKSDDRPLLAQAMSLSFS